VLIGSDLRRCPTDACLAQDGARRREGEIERDSKIANVCR